MDVNRRAFLKTTGLGLVAGLFLPKVFLRMADAATTGGKKTLVVVFQRFAVDGLNMVVPYGEDFYYGVRPTIAIPRPGKDGGAIDLNGFFGFHPELSPLLDLFKNHSLAIVHACGSPDPSRSHFDAQDFMESGTPGVKATPDGFLARAVGAVPQKSPAPFRAVAISPALPRILTGSCGAVAMTRLSDFGVRGAGNAATFEDMYAGAVAGLLEGTARDSFEAAKILKSADPEKIPPANGARYPAGPFGHALQEIARLIKSDVGLEVAFADIQGWDTHVAEGSSNGQLANRLKEFAGALSAFSTDLGSRMADITVVTCSEFGRTVRENGNRGTDHGHGNVMFVLGGGVKGGKIYGDWPGLASGNLYQGRDLSITTDFRDVFGEVLAKRLGARDLSTVFPGYANAPARWRGLIAA